MVISGVFHSINMSNVFKFPRRGKATHERAGSSSHCGCAVFIPSYFQPFTQCCVDWFIESFVSFSWWTQAWADSVTPFLKNSKTQQLSENKEHKWKHLCNRANLDTATELVPLLFIFYVAGAKNSNVSVLKWFDDDLLYFNPVMHEWFSLNEQLSFCLAHLYWIGTK